LQGRLDPARIDQFERFTGRKDVSSIRVVSLWTSPTIRKRQLLQERMAALVESSNDAIISKDLQGCIRSWKPGGRERLFGYTAEEIVGRHISTLAIPDRADEIPDILARIARGERVDHYETKAQDKRWQGF